MIHRLKRTIRKYRGLNSRAVLTVSLIAMLCVSGAGVALAQVGGEYQGTFERTFEEEIHTDGWTEYPAISGDNNSSYPQISLDSVNGNYSMFVREGNESGNGTAMWEDGPKLNTTEQFEVRSTFRYEQGGGGAENTYVRLGIASNDVNAQEKNAFIIFNGFESSTYLATYATAPDPGGSNSLGTDFEGQWVNVIIDSNETHVRAKVWEVGTGEPSVWQLERTFTGTRGEFSVNVGTSGGSIGSTTRQAWLDDVNITGTAVPEQQSLVLDTRSFYRPGATHPYSVNKQVYNVIEDTNTTFDVTDNSTVTSENSTLLQVHEHNQTMPETNDKNVTEIVNVTATYQNLTVTKQIVIGQATVENLEILPDGLTRTEAIVTDDTIFALIVAALLSVPAARFTSSFGGLAVAEMVIVVGFLGGYVSLGVAMLSVFVALFIGLNLAENVDYSRVSGGRFR